MSRQSGRSGIGSHKHGTSGHTRPNPRNMQEVARDLNADHEEMLAARARAAPPMSGSVREALGEQPGKRKRRKKGRKKGKR